MNQFIPVINYCKLTKHWRKVYHTLSKTYISKIMNKSTCFNLRFSAIDSFKWNISSTSYWPCKLIRHRYTGSSKNTYSIGWGLIHSNWTPLDKFHLFESISEVEALRNKTFYIAFTNPMNEFYANTTYFLSSFKRGDKNTIKHGLGGI